LSAPGHTRTKTVIKKDKLKIKIKINKKKGQQWWLMPTEPVS
jgi:hypothetical protein